MDNNNNNKVVEEDQVMINMNNNNNNNRWYVKIEYNMKEINKRGDIEIEMRVVIIDQEKVDMVKVDIIRHVHIIQIKEEIIENTGKGNMKKKMKKEKKHRNKL